MTQFDIDAPQWQFGDLAEKYLQKQAQQIAEALKAMEPAMRKAAAALYEMHSPEGLPDLPEFPQ